MITKIISGGQTGAVRGGLDAAIPCGIPHGGWCPKGRIAEDGVIPNEYHLNEMVSSKYLPRTKANVFDSDATVIFTYGPLSGGSLQTATYAHHLEKPYHDVDLQRMPRGKAVEGIVLWLGESHSPGLQEAVFQLMFDVLIQVSPACKHFYSIGDSQSPIKK